MRPRAWYVIFQQGQAVDVVQGESYATYYVAQLKEAGYSASYKKCRSEYHAQEFASWWNYDHPRHY